MKVLKFGADWCNGCLVMKPRWQEIEKEHSWLKTQYFDFDKDRQSVKKYRVEEGRLPVFVFLDKQGKEFLRKEGEIGRNELVKIILKNKDR